MLNSHDTTYAAQAYIESLILKCMNGAASPEFSAFFKSKHTTGISADAFSRQIEVGIDMLEKDKERMERYIRTPLNRDQAETMFKLTIAKLPDKPGGEPNWSAALVKRLLELYDEEGTENVWAAYMAMTAWATHDEVRGSGNDLTARVGRNARVATAQRAKEFKELLAA